MRIGIIGAGFTGLGIANYLDKKDDITIIDEGSQVGGIAQGFKEEKWNWHIDKLIHHWFATDNHIFELAKKLNVQNNIILKNTKSSCFKNGKIAELDSASSLLKFPFLRLKDKLKTGITIVYFRMQKNWKKYENKTSYDIIKKTMGQKSFEVIWKPLFEGKFGKYADKINGAWIWARINPRTKSLGYYKGGFQEFLNVIEKNLKENNVKILKKTKVSKIIKKNDKFIVLTDKGKKEFDIIVLAVPFHIAFKLFSFDEGYKKEINKTKQLSCQYVIFELRNKFLDDGTYWLNINEENFPFMLVAEHTNFMDKKNYNNNHLIYVGKYLEKDDKLMKLNKNQLIKLITSYLKKIKHNFSENEIENSYVFRFDYCQPVFPLNYSKTIPSIKTDVKNLYVANMNHIYPWDRGTNNALEIAEKVAKIINTTF